MRHYLLLGIVMAFGWLCESCNPAASSQTTNASDPPNLILIMADDLGYETLGCNGSTSYQTPRLDALAASGTRFTRCYAQPLCTPSRVKIMTGKYNFRNYVGFGILDPGEQTFAHLLRDAGYATCVVGKWQLYGNERQREMFQRTGSTPEQAGFDEYCLWQVKEKYGPRFKDPWLEKKDAEARQAVGDYGPDAYTRHAMDFISRKKDSNFFLYFPMALVHDPFQPSPDHEDYPEFDSSTRLNDTTYFADNMAYMDKVVGRLIDHLEAEGLRENTLILFTGDNGTDRDVISSVKGKRIRGNKGYPTEAGTRVPLMASWPGQIPEGEVREDLIDFTDFLPTLLEASGASLPDGFMTDGTSFYPALTDQAGKGREWLFCHYAPQWGKFEPRRFVHNAEWKLYQNGEIYHTSIDPEEQQPVAESDLSPETKALIQQFSEVLDRLQ